VLHKYYVDEFYDAAVVKPLIEGSTRILWRGIDAGTIDGAINNSAEGAQGVSDALRRMQSGNIRSYAGWVAFGAGVILAYMVWMGAQ